jgi:hypothetical protein
MPQRPIRMNARLLVMVSGLMLAASLPLRAANAPRIACRQTVYDFGTRESINSVEHVFTIFNDGDAPLQIGQVRGCCGATATIADMSISPGSNTALKVVFSLAGRGGKQNKSFYLGSNDPKEPYLQLRLVGNVVETLNASPRSIDFGVLEQGASTNAEVFIVCTSNLNLTVTNAVADAGFAVEFGQGPSNNLWRITVRPASPPLGLTRGRVTILTDHKDYPKLEIPVTVTVASDIVAVPKEIVVTETGEKPQPVTRYVAVRSRTGKPFKILKLEAPDSDIKLSHEQIASGGYRITLANVMPFEDLNGKDLVIVTDHPQTKKVTVPFLVNRQKQD